MLGFGCLGCIKRDDSVDRVVHDASMDSCSELTSRTRNAANTSNSTTNTSTANGRSADASSGHASSSVDSALDTSRLPKKLAPLTVGGAMPTANKSEPKSKSSSKQGGLTAAGTRKYYAAVGAVKAGVRAEGITLRTQMRRCSHHDEDVKLFLEARYQTLLTRVLAYVPKVVISAIQDKRIQPSTVIKPNSTEGLLIQHCKGVVAFIDASGFTQLTERLAVSPHGAEMLSGCLNLFMTPLIQIINKHGGDVMKFSGDAVSVMWPFEEEEEAREMVLMATACCIELHAELHNFDTQVPLGDPAEKRNSQSTHAEATPSTPMSQGSSRLLSLNSMRSKSGDAKAPTVKLTLHIGVGVGNICVFQVGGSVGTYDQFEYVLGGPPMTQIGLAEPLASSGETVLSPEAFHYIKEDCGICSAVEKNPAFWKVDGLKSAVQFEVAEWMIKHDSSKYVEVASRSLNDPSFVHLLARYVPRPVFTKLRDPTGGKDVNEMRNLVVMFIKVSGLDTASDAGVVKAQVLMRILQRVVYTAEGGINKFLVDDKGLLVLVGFGLPPMVHNDDALRAVLTAQRIIRETEGMALEVHIGVTLGRVWCGIMGSDMRQEYTFLGDDVNLSARLMGAAEVNGVLVNDGIFNITKNSLNYTELPQIRVKGKTDMIRIFKPEKLVTPADSNPANCTIHFPWPVTNRKFGGPVPITSLTTLQANKQLQATLRYTTDPEKMVKNSSAMLWFLGKRGQGKVALAEYAIEQFVEEELCVPVMCWTRSVVHIDSLHPVKSVFFNTVKALVREDPSNKAKVHDFVNQALEKVQSGLSLDTLAEFMTKETIDTMDLDVVAALIDCAYLTVAQLCDDFTEHGMLLVMRGSTGTTYSENPWDQVLWQMSLSGYKVVEAKRAADQGKRLVIITIARKLPDIDVMPEVIETSKTLAERDWQFVTSNLQGDSIDEFIRVYLKLGEKVKLDANFRKFVIEYSMANPRFMVEVLDRLTEFSLIAVEDGVLKGVQDLDDMDEKVWANSNILSEIQTDVERLKPDLLKVLKVACELKSFETSDITHIFKGYTSTLTRNMMDDIRTIKATSDLASLGMIELKDPGVNDTRYKLRRPLILRNCVQMLLLQNQRILIHRRNLLRKAASVKKVDPKSLLMAGMSGSKTPKPPETPTSDETPDK